MEGKSAVELTTPLELDWNKLLPANDDDDDDPPPCLVIVKSKTLASENRTEPPAMDPHAEKHESYEQMTDHVLRERINSTKQSIPKIAHTLRDKGEKLRGSLKHMEAEMDRRKLRRVETIHLEVSLFSFFLFLFILCLVDEKIVPISLFEGAVRTFQKLQLSRENGSNVVNLG